MTTAHAINPPKQDRSRQTLQKLMDATEHILKQKSVEELTTREIVKVSGVSNGSLYARFSGKEALLTAIWDELVRSIDGDIINRYDELAGEPLADKVRFLVEWRISRYIKYRGLLRSFRTLTSSGKIPGSARYKRMHLESRERIVEFLMHSAEEIRHANKKQAIKLAEFVTTSAARELILFPNGLHASTMKISRSNLVAELTGVFLSYLGWTPIPESSD